ncbi:MAG: hypothetical protein A2542_03190 [Parcubacteria group bacterium RIFOXYD2_FULL_52_8]|nr:MAG: hypothetical protein A2542_03190 [Parcubacteria group bacterium RIFOXYD2_FULL_52_8]
MHRVANLITSLLKKTERYTKTDMLYVAEGGFWLTLGRVVATISSLLMTVILANMVTPTVLGNYKFVASLGAIFVGFSLTGMTTAITQAVARGYEAVYPRGFAIHLQWGTIALLLAVGTSGYYFFQGNVDLALAVLIVGLCIPLTQAASLYSPFFIGRKDFKSQTWYDSVFAVVPVVVTLLSLFWSTSLVSIVGFYFLSNCLTVYAIYLHSLRHFPPNDRMDGSALGYGKHLSLMNILGGISFQLDRVLIFHYLGAAELAVYAIAQAGPQQLRYLSKVLSTIVLPKFSLRSPDELKESVPRKAWIVFLGALPLALAYILLAPLLYHLFFPQYEASVIYSQVFALVILFFPSMLFQQSLLAQKQQRQLYITQVSVPLIKIILLAILTPLYGMWGALASIFGMEIYRFFLVVYYFNRMNPS